MDETLRLLELYANLTDSHRIQVLALAEAFAEWEERYDDP